MTEEIITSRKNSLLQEVRRLFSSRKDREAAGLFAADGTKLLQEAVNYFPGLHTVILQDGVECDTPAGVRRVRVSRDLMASISPMDAPQGAIFLGKIPEKPVFTPQKAMLLLDGIQDPGNLGTILRTADAMDIPVALLEGCADLWNAKTVRASMGAVLRKPVMEVTWEEAEKAFRDAGIPLGVTALSDTARDIRSAALSEMAVVIGSEGRGVRPQVLERADEKLIIPMNPHCESLNAAVAATICMWEMKK